jgi:hypothetical protein
MESEKPKPQGEAVSPPGADGTAQVVPVDFTPAEKEALNKRLNEFNALAKITAEQMNMLMGPEVSNHPLGVLVALLYNQVRQLQCLYDGMTDLLLAGRFVVAVPNPDKPDDFQAGKLGVSPLSRKSYFDVTSLKAEQMTTSIRRQMLSAGGAVPKKQ